MKTIEEQLAACEEQLDEWMAALLAADPLLDPKAATPAYLTSRLSLLTQENAILRARLARRSAPAEASTDFFALVQQEVATIRPESGWIEEHPLELYARLLREVNGVFELLLPGSAGATGDQVRAQTAKVAAFGLAIFESWIA